MLPCSIHIDFGSFEKVLWNLCKNFGKSHGKSQELNHVLVPIEGKDLKQQFLLGIVLGVLEGLIKRGLFWFSILTPSSVQCIVHLYYSVTKLSSLKLWSKNWLHSKRKSGWKSVKRKSQENFLLLPLQLIIKRNPCYIEVQQKATFQRSALCQA